MDIGSYFSSGCKSSVISSSRDSEDVNESEINVQSNPLIAQVLLLNHLPSQDLESGSGISIWNQEIKAKWDETFLWFDFDPNLQDTLWKLCKKDGRSLQRTGGVWNAKPQEEGNSENITIFTKVKCTFYCVNWTWKLIELEKKDPLSASFKMLESSKDTK